MIIINEKKLSKITKKTTILNTLSLLIISFINVLVTLMIFTEPDDNIIVLYIGLIGSLLIFGIAFVRETLSIIYNIIVIIFTKSYIRDSSSFLKIILTDKFFISNDDKYDNNSYILKDYRVNNYCYRGHSFKFGLALLYLLFFLYIFVHTTQVNSILVLMILNYLYFYFDFILVPLISNKMFKIYGYTDKESYVKLIKFHNFIEEIKNTKQGKEITKDNDLTLLPQLMVSINDTLFNNKKMQNIITTEIEALTDFLNILELDKKQIIKSLNSKTKSEEVIKIIDNTLNIHYQLTTNLIEKIHLELEESKDNKKSLTIIENKNYEALENISERTNNAYFKGDNDNNN